MPCTKCEEGNYKWGETGECKYDTLESCESANSKYNKMQPTPLGKKTYEEYEKELKEYNLSKVERIDLSLVGDIKGIVDRLNNVDNQSMDIVTESGILVKEIKGFLKERKSEVEKKLKKINLAIKELGTLQKEANTLETKVNKASKELGIDQKDIYLYEDLIDYANDADDTIVDLEDVKGELDKISMNL